ncbi:LysM peptidoglycan-binding domain-containing protein [Tenacibaculum finnmarkense]|uniref:LysM peptidoglycan-binding domain-containing protein n=1 Tax=Tenacibaculum finnmarkense TaxID=2781243 RepID=UPI001EFACDA9|nr:LysM peptidoglycan-binding domain-containing protein [Tenacibaculum finnmarkense]MCG8894389.1 LysM peptidoglycan-binding domain-containing protein [Tenacibaculum finnmarkense]
MQEWKFKHTVKSGEGQWNIVKKHNVSAEELASKNGLGKTDGLKKGQILLVPNSGGTCCKPVTEETSPESTPSTFKHTVKPGESQWSVAKKHKIPAKELANKNGLGETDNLEVGQTLLVSNSGGACCEPVIEEVCSEPTPFTYPLEENTVAVDNTYVAKKFYEFSSFKTKLIEETIDNTVDKDGKNGYLVCDRATFCCNMSTVANSKGTAIPNIAVTKNKKVMIAENKLVITNKETDEKSFNFGVCSAKYPNPPCLPKIVWQDFYANIDIEKSGQNPLLSCSKGTCSTGGGTVEIAENGQGGDVSAIMEDRVNGETVLYMVNPMLAASEAKRKPYVSSISAQYNNEKDICENIKGKKSITIEKTTTNKPIFFTAKPRASSKNNDLINWVVYKKVNGTYSKYKIFANYGKTLQLNIKDMPEGDYQIEGYGRNSSTSLNNCSIAITYKGNKLNELVVTKGDKGLKGVPMIFEAKYTFKVPIYNLLRWKVSQLQGSQKTLLYNKENNFLNDILSVDAFNLLSLKKAFSIKDNTLKAIFSNGGEYQVEVYDSNNFTKVYSKKVTVENNLSIQKVTAQSGSVLRKTDTIKVQVNTNSTNVSEVYVAGQNPYWYLQKDGVEVANFSLRGLLIDKSINALVAEAGLATPYGKYILEVYGKVATGTKQFAGNDQYTFTVTKNKVTGIIGIPETVPVGSSITPKIKTVFEPLLADEKVQLEVAPADIAAENVTLNNNGTITINKIGEYTFKAYLTGADADATIKESFTIKAVSIIFEKALWAYGTGRKRWQTGYNENTYAYIDLQGVSNLKAILSIWIQPKGIILEDIIADVEKKYFVEKQTVTFDTDGKAQLKINTGDSYKEKIENLYSSTEILEVPLLFTLAFTASNNTVSLPKNPDIKNKDDEALVSITSDESINEYLVLDTTERLVLSAKQKVKSILFSNPEKTNIATGSTTVGNEHAIWVHTTGMVDEKLTVVIYQELQNDEIAASFSVTTHPDTQQEITQCVIASEVNRYEDVPVPADGFLEIMFEVPEIAITTNYVNYTVEVFKKDADGNLNGISESHGYTSSFIQKHIGPNAAQVELIAVGNYDDAPDEVKLKLAKNLVCHNKLHALPTLVEPEGVPPVPVMAEVGEIKRTTSTCANCDKDITALHMKAMFPNASLTDLTAVMNAYNDHMEEFGMNTCYNKAHFFAQAMAETGKKLTFEENLNYSAKGIVSEFSRIRKNETYIKEAYLYGRLNDQSKAEKNKAIAYGREIDDLDADKENIANIIYDDRKGATLGNTSDGDGWKYAGRGIIQLTGKENFNKVNDANAMESYKVSNPDELLDKKKGTLFGMGYWKMKGMHLLTLGRFDNTFLTYIINKNTDSYEKRQEKFRGISARGRNEEVKGTRHFFKVEECKVADILELKPNRAPWIQYAAREYNRFNGYHFKQSPLKWKIYDYFELSSYSKGTNETAWCAAFVNWCFWKTEEYRNTNQHANVGAYDWLYTGHSKIKRDDGWENGEEISIEDVFVGAVLVMTEESHITFVVGETADKTRFVTLGGNQGMGEGKRGITLSSFSKAGSFVLMKPKEYEPTDFEKELPILIAKGELSYENTH